MLAATRKKASCLWWNRRAFIRWAWLRATGKTAYGFSPLHKTTMGAYVSIGGAPEIRQANGLVLPDRTKPPTDPTLRADVEAAWDAAYAVKRKKLRAVK